MVHLSQSAVSKYEQMRVIDDEMLHRFSRALGVPFEYLKSLEEDAQTVVFEYNTVNDSEQYTGGAKISLGNFVKKAMRECTGEEICREWLYHIGIPEDRIGELAATACNTTTCYMPYINAFFQPRKESDRPKVVPDGAVNFAFVGQFAETPRDTIFTTEYSMRTGMESVYTLLDIDRGVPEVWGSKYDVRELLRACYYAVDKKPISELPLSFGEREAVKILLKKVKGTDVELLLRESGLLE